jgi:hypothetical protein
MEWILPLLGGLGIGSIITKLLDHLISLKKDKESRLYQEKRETYLGVLDSLKIAATEPSNENAKAFAYWHARAELFGSYEVAEAIQGMIDTNNPKDSEKRNMYYTQLLIAMKSDLGV